MCQQKTYYHFGNVELFWCSSTKFLVDNLRERYETHKRAKIPEPPVFEVIQPFKPLNKHYVNDRTFRLNARFFSMQKGKSDFFASEGVRKIPSRFRPWSLCPSGV